MSTNTCAHCFKAFYSDEKALKAHEMNVHSWIYVFKCPGEQRRRLLH